MKFFIFFTTCCCLLLSLVPNTFSQSVFVRQPQAEAALPYRPSSRSSAATTSDLQAEETGLYPAGGLHSLSGYQSGGGAYGMPLHGTYSNAYGGLGGGALGSGLSSGSYDDLHKYGGIGKKAHTSSLYDHGSKGYKDYYGDAAYGNQGLNKYSNQHSSDNFGGAKGNHANYHGNHVYTRNRGYGYEKTYMYDKEFSTAKQEGTKGGHHSYYGDHKKGGQSSVKAFKNYGGKKYGAKKGHDEHAYGKYGHLLDNHGEHYLKANAGLGKASHLGMPHLETSGYSSGLGEGVGGGYMGGHNEYMPVIESYGGALGHGGGGHLPSVGYDHGADSGMMDTYDTQPNPSVVYVPNAGSSGRGGENSGEQVDDIEPPPMIKQASMAHHPNTAALISTKMGGHSGGSTSGLSTPPMYATLGSAYTGSSRGGGGALVNSAVHATPAVISTHSNGAHYYNS